MLFKNLNEVKSQGKKIGITFSTFDLGPHAGHIAMLAEAKQHCDYLIAGLQTDPSIDRPTKNKPVQSVIERQIQLAACRYVDEVIVYETEQDLVDLLLILPVDVRILGVEYEHQNFTGRDECITHGIELIFNHRDHSFSSSGLRKRVIAAESTAILRGRSIGD